MEFFQLYRRKADVILTATKRSNFRLEVGTPSRVRIAACKRPVGAGVGISDPDLVELSD